MNLHPALLAVLVVDALGIGCLALAVAGAARVELGWQPSAPTAAQLTLERRSEEASALARVGLVLHASAALVLLLVLNHVLPGLVPGAMCGVGALQAMPGGTLAIAVRGAALAALVVWSTTDELNRRSPTGALARGTSRALMLAAPIAAVASWQTAQALMNVDTHAPVSCCAAVYDLALVSGSHEAAARIAGGSHALAAGALAAMVASVAMALRRQAASRVPPRWLGAWLVAASFAWAVLASWSLVDVFGPYLYGALGHRCPLCIFLPQHHGVGYPLAAAWIAILAESLAAATAIVAAKATVDAREAARVRVRAAGLRVTVALLVFVALSVGPALAWRLRFGVWIDPI